MSETLNSMLVLQIFIWTRTSLESISSVDLHLCHPSTCHLKPIFKYILHKIRKCNLIKSCLSDITMKPVLVFSAKISSRILELKGTIKAVLTSPLVFVAGVFPASPSPRPKLYLYSALVLPPCNDSICF